MSKHPLQTIFFWIFLFLFLGFPREIFLGFFIFYDFSAILIIKDVDLTILQQKRRRINP